MKPASFAYLAPKSLAEAVDLLSAHSEARRLIAGGQSLGPMLNMRVAQPEVLIDLNTVPELDGIRERDGAVLVGAMARHHDVAHHPLVRRHAPLLAHAAVTIGHYAIRQRGTSGGSLAHADPAAQMPSVAVALGAEMEVVGSGGSRRIPAADFFLSTFETALAEGEILTAIRFPVTRAGEGWGFRLFARRPGDFAVALACTHLDAAGELTIVLGGVAPIPVATRHPIAGSLDDANLPGVLASSAAAALELEDEPRVPGAYRREIASAVAEDAIRDALRRRAERLS